MGDRFIKLYSQGTIKKIEIWEDRETGIKYLFIKEGYGAGLTPLLNAKGEPEGKRSNP